jgi:hypothetical protein
VTITLATKTTSDGVDILIVKNEMEGIEICAVAGDEDFEWPEAADRETDQIIGVYKQAYDPSATPRPALQVKQEGYGWPFRSWVAGWMARRARTNLKQEGK